MIQIIVLTILFSITNSLRNKCTLQTDYLLKQGIHSTNNGATQITGKMTNDAYEFNGIDQYLSYPANNIGGQITISFQAIWKSQNSWSRILDFGNNNEGEQNILIANPGTSNDITIQVINNSQVTGQSLVNEIVLNSDWVHYVILVKTNGIDFYKNGSLISSVQGGQVLTSGIFTTNRFNNYSGRSNWSVDAYFNGKIDELTIYQYQASTQQIECLFDVCNVSKCQLCKDNSNKCDQCIGNRISTNCSCPSNTISNSTEDTCPTCINKCSECSDTYDNCDSCKGDRINSNCDCPVNKYDDYVSLNCQNCPFLSCNTCNSTECLTCLGSTSQSSSRITNQCTCPQKYYSDIENNLSNIECLACPFEGCSTCNSTECLTCLGTTLQDSSRISNQCICPQGYFSDIPNNIANVECLICDNKCVQCTESSVNCDSCRGNRINKPSCACPDNYYENGTQENCIQCNYEGCQSCNSTQCITCLGTSGQPSSRINNDCVCPPSYFSDILNNQNECQACNFKCSECTNSSDNCTVCKGDRVIDNSCACPYHKYDDNSSINCIECDNLCEECNLNGCQVCRYNRIPDITVGQEQTCLCESSDIDHFSTLGSYWCTSCTTAVITPKFSNDYKTIYIQFYDTISIQGYTNDGTQQEGTNGVCNHIFDQDILQKLGQNCKCRLDVGQKQIVIFLGQQPNITNDIDEIQFKQDVIQRDGCDANNEFINNYHENTLLIADNPLPPSAEVISPTGKVTLCQEIVIQITNIINDGLRGLNNIQWEVLSNSPSTEKLDILLNLQNSNNQMDTFLVIPMLTFDPYQVYNLQIQYLNFAGQLGISQFTIETLSQKGTYAKIQQTQPFVFKIWKQNELQADVNYLDCSSGELLFINSPLKIDWVDITTDTNNQVSLESYLTEPTQKNIEYVIEKYSLVAGITYKILLKVNIENEPLMESTHFVEYLIETSPLNVYIEGGNRLQAYANELDLQGQALDPDVSTEFQKQGITLNWECINMIDQQGCKNIGGELIPLGTDTFLNYQKKFFEPYNSYQFTFNGDNGDKQNSDIAIIIVIETDLPVLTVSIPQQVRNQKINKNDDLQMEITSSQDPDEAFYSLIIIYKFEVVATQSYNYNKFAFQIWDIYNNFDLDDNEFLLRVSVYDPQYFMPSQASFQALINYEPLIGNILITPTQGIALDTIFTIQCENFYDEDQPLTYKYSYYTNSQDYQTEIQQGGKQIQVFKNLIQDYSNQNSIQTILPSGYQDNLLLLVSVSDALGAVRNVTQSINIQKMSENNYIDNLNNLKNIYNLNKDKGTSIKLSQINLMVQELGSIFLNSEGNGYEILQDSSIEQQYIQFKKEVYDDIMSFVGNINSKVLEDQVMKSINILQNVGGNLVKIQGSDEINQQIQKVDQIINNQKEILKQMVQDNLLNQGDNKITKKQNNINEILGKSMSFMDKMSKNINDEVKRRRFLTEQDIQQQYQIYEISKNIKSTIQQVMLPNSDQISFTGENISQEVQVLTPKKLQSKYFNQKQQGLQILTNKEEVLNTDTQQGQVYKSAGTGFKTNPFLSDEGFPYKDQDTSIQDIDITIEGETEDTELTLENQEISMSFEKSTDSEANNSCIQRDTASTDKKWSSLDCITEDQETSEFVRCNCKKLTPATVINDISNIFANGQAQEVFSNQGLEIGYKRDQQDILKKTKLTTEIINIEILESQQSASNNQKNQNQDKQKLHEQHIKQDLEKQLNNNEDQQIQGKDSNQIQEQGNKSNLNNVMQNSDSMKSSEKFMIQKKKRKSKKKRQIQIKGLEDDVSSQKSVIQNEEQNTNKNNNNVMTPLSDFSNKVKDFNENQDIMNLQSNRSQNNSLDNISQNIVQKQKKQSFSQQTLQKSLFVNSQKSNKVYSISDQDNDLLNEEKDQEKKKKEREKIEIKKKASEALYGFHSFFGIYLIYKDDLSRPSRYIIYFIRINMLLAITALFSLQMTQFQSLLFSVVASIILAIPSGILQMLLKKKMKIILLIGVLLSVLFFLLSLYIVFVTSALMGIDKANEWSISYLSSFCINTFMYEPISGYIKVLLLKQEIVSLKTNCFKKLFGDKSIINYLVGNE